MLDTWGLQLFVSKLKGVRAHCYYACNSCRNVSLRHKSSKRTKEEVQALRIYLRVQAYSLKWSMIPHFFLKTTSFNDFLRDFNKKPTKSVR